MPARLSELFFLPKPHTFLPLSRTSSCDGAGTELNQYLLGKEAAKPEDGFSLLWSGLGGAAGDRKTWLKCTGVAERGEILLKFKTNWRTKPTDLAEQRDVTVQVQDAAALGYGDGGEVREWA